jgi:hypothetical protein
MMRGLGSMLDVLDLILSSIVNKTKKNHLPMSITQLTILEKNK